MSETQVDNGVNVEALLAAREALTEAPEGAKFNWRAQCKWVNGTHSSSVVEGFFGLGEEQHHRTEFKFDSDHPEIFASEDNGGSNELYRACNCNLNWRSFSNRMKSSSWLKGVAR